VPPIERPTSASVNRSGALEVAISSSGAAREGVARRAAHAGAERTLDAPGKGDIESRASDERLGEEQRRLRAQIDEHAHRDASPIRGGEPSARVRDVALDGERHRDGIAAWDEGARVAHVHDERIEVQLDDVLAEEARAHDAGDGSSTGGAEQGVEGRDAHVDGAERDAGHVEHEGPRVADARASPPRAGRRAGGGDAHAHRVGEGDVEQRGLCAGVEDEPALHDAACADVHAHGEVHARVLELEWDRRRSGRSIGRGRGLRAARASDR
jgi:hypothetical protein